MPRSCGPRQIDSSKGYIRRSSMQSLYHNCTTLMLCRLSGSRMSWSVISQSNSVRRMCPDLIVRATADLNRLCKREDLQMLLREMPTSYLLQILQIRSKHYGALRKRRMPWRIQAVATRLLCRLPWSRHSHEHYVEWRCGHGRRVASDSRE